MQPTNLITTSIRLTLLLGLIVSLSISSIHAATRTWTGGHVSSANWNLRDNWSGAAVPTHGDTLVFPSGAARIFNTNNIAGLRLAGIQFTGAAGGYNLRGLGVTITNGITLIEGSGNTVSLESLTLGGNQAFHIPSGGVLTMFSDVDLNGFNLSFAAIGDFTMRGAINGNGNVNKSGAGQLSLSGAKDNTFAGSLTIASGTLAMNRFETISLVPFTQESRIAVPGNLILGNGSGTVLATTHFDHQIANTGTVTINEDATLNFNDHDDTAGDIVLKGGVINTGTGTLTLGGNVSSLSSAGSAVINGLLFLGGDRTFSIADGPTAIDLDVRANIAGGIAGIIKTGVGTLRLGGTNSYLGMTYVNGGQLNVGNDSALGAINGTTVVNTNAQLLLELAVNTLVEHLTLSGTGIGGTNAALRVAGSAVIQNDVRLNAPATINVPAGSGLSLEDVVDGTGPLTKIGGGTLQLAGSSANTFTDGLFAKEGLLLLSKLAGSAVQGDLVIGTTNTTATVRHTRSANLGGAVTVNSGSLYDLDGFNESIDSLTFIGGGVVRTDSGLLTVDSDITVLGAPFEVVDNAAITGRLRLGSVGTAHVTVLPAGDSSPDYVQLIVSAQVSGPAAIIKNGTGLATLIASNTFTGSLTVEEGRLNIRSSHALGSPAGDTFVEGDGILGLGFEINVEDERLVLNSTATNLLGGYYPSGALLITGTNTWSGPVFLTKTACVSVYTNSELNIKGVINGLAGLTKSGPGLLVYSGTASNTYIGPTLVSEGTLRLERGGGANRAIPGALVVGDGVGGPGVDVVEAVAPSQINNLSQVTVDASGALRVLGDDLIGSLSGSGRVDLLGALVELQTGENDASTTFTGAILGTGGLRKRGSGTFTLTGTNSYTGFTAVNEGTLVINGQQPSSDVIVSAGGTLGGVGRIGDLTVLGTLAPGSPFGRLQAASVDFAPGSDYAVELNGPSSNTGYDSFYSTGAVDVAGATLDVSLSFSPYAGQEFDISIWGTLAGTFAGLPEGSEIVLNQIPLHLTYAGAYGHGIVLTVGDLALRLGGTRVESGNGNGRIDPNECNNLFLTIENPTGAAVNVVRAQLDSLDPRIAVTQGEGIYGNIPALGFRTNRTAFQIRSAPNYPCGLNARFHLVVDTSAHGRFSIPITLPTGSPGSFLTFPSIGGPQPIPPAGGLSSQLPVTDAFRVGKVRVSVHASHPAAGDLRFRLISPLGQEVLLSANRGGNAANYGNNCSSRTIFDDDALTKIAAATAPFAGTFAPEGNLADFIGVNSAGVWTLLAEDTVPGDLGAMQCWLLQLAPAECADGGGGCESCLASVSGVLDHTSPTMPHTLNYTAYESGCGNADSCPGVSAFGEAPFRYSTHSFTNTGPDTCVTVILNVPCAETDSGLFCSAYLGDFNPADLCANNIGFGGFDIEHGSGACTFRVPAGQRFTVVVNESNFSGPFQGCDSYSLELHGLPCPQPTLHIANDAGPDNVRLHWSTAYPGFQLQGKPSLGGPWIVSPSYTNVTTVPNVVAGRYSVTNIHSRTNNGFFRLRKP